MNAPTRVTSPVDYDAWQRGYMPTSEHWLIDQLQFRGAKVVAASDWGDTAYWIVMRGRRIYGKHCTAIMRSIEDAIEILAEEEVARAQGQHGDGI